jgi:hypothetical protein
VDKVGIVFLDALTDVVYGIRESAYIRPCPRIQYFRFDAFPGNHGNLIVGKNHPPGGGIDHVTGNHVENSQRSYSS